MKIVLTSHAEADKTELMNNYSSHEVQQYRRSTRSLQPIIDSYTELKRQVRTDY